MSCFAKNLSELTYFLTKYPLAVDSASRAFFICKKVFIEAEYSWKHWLLQIPEGLDKKMHEVVCGLVENVCNNTHLFCDFRYLKINCNFSVKSKVKCRRLSKKY